MKIILNQKSIHDILLFLFLFHESCIKSIIQLNYKKYYTARAQVLSTLSAILDRLSNFISRKYEDKKITMQVKKKATI